MILTDQVVLTQRSEDIKIEEYQEIFGKLEDVIQHTPNAIGLAAPQLGIMKRAFIIRHNCRIHRFANSRFARRQKRYESTESCLSIPDRTFVVPRFNIVLLKDDINGVKEYVGMFARIIQHEHDHTCGITLLQSGVEI